ncbi:LPD28 domain-containing protein [Lactococcus formosensis subsp. bovis]|uniref:LPD28 domain-containing protein n=1 Tax=Lactococcus formosensis TaxID=1281486 RepID=UPI001BCD1BE8|nr:LPD28 domain-containing protein [Lactococcus formosensis]
MSLQKLNIQSAEKFEEIEITLKNKTVKGLVSNLRVERSSVPKGVYIVGIREGDSELYGQLKNYVWVDHLIDVILKEELAVPEEGLYFLDEEDEKLDTESYNLNYPGGQMTLREFLQN